jgi:uncharacterized membrane protein
MSNPMPGQQGYAYSAPAGGGEKSSTGLDTNIAALLSYMLAPIGGLVFFFIEKNSRFVRIHAMQSIIFGVLAIVVMVALSIFAGILSVMHLGIISLLLFPVQLIIWLVFLLVWVLLVFKAYQNQIFKLPILGNMAEGFVK